MSIELPGPGVAIAWIFEVNKQWMTCALPHCHCCAFQINKISGKWKILVEGIVSTYNLLWMMEDVKLDTRFLPWFFTQVVILFIRKSWVDWWTEFSFGSVCCVHGHFSKSVRWEMEYVVLRTERHLTRKFFWDCEYFFLLWVGLELLGTVPGGSVQAGGVGADWCCPDFGS